MTIPRVTEIALVANLQTLGPTYVASATETFFDHGSGMLLAARMIITSGMGSNVKGYKQLHGPIPISEIEGIDDYECYYFPVEMKQDPHPDLDISTGKGSYVICVIVARDTKQEIRFFENLIEISISDILPTVNFENTVTGIVPMELNQELNAVLSKFLLELNEILKFAFTFKGGSLFDIGLISSLPEDLMLTAKKLMLNPKGVVKSEISNQNALKKLYQAGLVEMDMKDGEEWAVPR